MKAKKKKEDSLKILFLAEVAACQIPTRRFILLPSP
jgi:hypothetical protein